jgi:hypothetical protein
MNLFVDGQYTLLFYGNVQQYNDFRVTTSQQTVTVTPTVTVTSTPLYTQSLTTTETDYDTFTYTPPAVTSPATVDTVTSTPAKVTQYTTKTRTKTIHKLTYTAVPTIVTVAPKCKIDKPPRCKPLHPRFAFAAKRAEEIEEIDAPIEERSNELAKRAGVSTLQPTVTTTTKSIDLPTFVVTAATSTVTDLDTAYITITGTETAPVPTVYSGVSVVTVTAPARTKTK